MELQKELSEEARPSLVHLEDEDEEEDGDEDGDGALVSVEEVWPIVAANSNQRAILRASDESFGPRAAAQREQELRLARRGVLPQDSAEPNDAAYLSSQFHQRLLNHDEAVTVKRARDERKVRRQQDQLKRVEAAQSELRALEERRLEIAQQAAAARKREAQVAQAKRRGGAAQGRKRDSSRATGAESNPSTSAPPPAAPRRRRSAIKEKSVRDKVKQEDKERRDAEDKALREKEERRQRQRQYSKAVTELFKPSVDQTKAEEIKARRDVPRLPRLGVFERKDDAHEPVQQQMNAAQQRHMLREIFKDRADNAQRDHDRRERDRRLEEGNRARMAGGWGKPHQARVPKPQPEPSSQGRLVVRLPAVPHVQTGGRNSVRHASAPPTRPAQQTAGPSAKLPRLGGPKGGSDGAKTAAHLVAPESGGDLLAKARKLEDMAREKDAHGGGIGGGSALEESMIDSTGGDDAAADALYMQAIEAKLQALQG